MEGEAYNFIVVWFIILVSLLYCHDVGKVVAPGTTRFLALFPVICLFLYLTYNLRTMFLCGLTFFFVAWLGNFKLLLFVFGQGPLSSNSPLPLSHFIPTACLPIKIIYTKSTAQKMPKKSRKSPKDYATRTILFFVAVKFYGYKDYVHPLLTTPIYAYYLFFVLELLLAMTASMTRTLAGVELEPQFDEPHHATSVQNFWGKRWNLMVSSILRPTVYHPARAIFGRVVPQKWVSVPAVLTTFLVSGIMHEVIFYYLGRHKPTWEITCFFIVQGLWIGTEIVIKKTIGQKFKLPPLISRSLTLAFVILTSFWLFFPPYLSLNPHVRSCKEAMAFLEFLKHGHLLSPDECACPGL